jgi:hypothetical protein
VLRVALIGLSLLCCTSAVVAEEAVGVTGAGRGVGQPVAVQERLAPNGDGPRQVLFLDRSALSLDADGDVTVEDFTFDPALRQGRLAISATAGTLRFVGGSISKTGDVTIRTPTASVSLQGGIAFVEVQRDGRTAITLGYGVEATVTSNDGATVRLIRPGQTVSVAPQGGISAPSRAEPSALDQLIRRVEGGAGLQPARGAIDQRAGPLPVNRP